MIRELIIVVVSAITLGFAGGIFVGEKKQMPCIQAYSGPEFVRSQFVCLALKDTYVCNINGKAEVYARDGKYVAPLVVQAK